MLSHVRYDKSAADARAYLQVFVASLFLGCVVVMATLLFLDPYATGRLTWINHPVSFDTTSSKSSVSRIRNPQFNAVIVGNSTLQTLDPDRLNALTSQTFSQITVPGTGPMEQAVMLRYIARERGDGIKTVVVGLDMTWCNPAAMFKTTNPFPFWLYDDSLFRYASGLFRADNLEALPRRIRVLLGKEHPARLDGFWNYELHVPAKPYPFAPARAVQTERSPHSAALALRGALQAFPASVRIVLVLAPVYNPADANRPFEDATGTKICKTELSAAANSRPNTAVVDRWHDSPLNQNRDLFLDAVHFRAPIARDIEQGIALSLSRL